MVSCPALVGVVTDKKIPPSPRCLYTNSHIFDETIIHLDMPDHHPQFFTATILEWKHLLTKDSFKDIIIDSLRFLKNEGSIVVYGFVIMPNHIHLVWQIQDGFKRENIQMRFLKFTAQQMKFKLMDTNDSRLDDFRVKVSDRQYQFWERKALSVDLWSWPVFVQKLDYTHNNPVKDKWKLVASPEDYKYSSSKFYVKGID